MQDLVRRQPRVVSTRVGHTDGAIANPTYRSHPGHTEAIEVTPASRCWEAEPEHQDHLERYPGGRTCHFARPGWRLPVRTQTPA